MPLMNQKRYLKNITDNDKKINILSKRLCK